MNLHDAMLLINKKESGPVFIDPTLIRHVLSSYAYRKLGLLGGLYRRTASVYSWKKRTKI